MVPAVIVTLRSIPPGHCVRIHQTDACSPRKMFATPIIIFPMSRAPTNLFRTQRILPTRAHRTTTSQTRLFHITFLHTGHSVRLCLTDPLAQRPQGTLNQIFGFVWCLLRVLLLRLAAGMAPVRLSMADYGSMKQNSSRA
jgi:hypothetical protein